MQLMAILKVQSQSVVLSDVWNLPESKFGLTGGCVVASQFRPVQASSSQFKPVQSQCKPVWNWLYSYMFDDLQV